MPLTLTWPRYHQSLEPPAVILLRGPQGYLELKLDTRNGELLEMVIPSAAATVKTLPEDFRPASGQNYVPLVHATPEQDTIEVPDLHFEIHGDHLRITLHKQPEERYVGADSVFFGVGAEGLLVSVILQWAPLEREHFLSSCSSVETV
ncbi:hypothetical protein [Microbispora triticiradicis]|uniref:hypothetical protein n=1 Tax=Microbispora triticiradicis TaxID=2200763 RepID=UPI001AD6DBB9|nr:hypothetical protein [Microbispora triticiradicis]MBO4270643.1 hypothetical protein [Microbispora triticiradicis]